MSATHRSVSAKGKAAAGPLAAVPRVKDERSYLYELIQTIGAGPNLEAILRGVVRLVTEATACHACFIYFLRDEALELRAASSMYEHLEGTVRIPSGEGLTGWVARTRRAAYLKEGALQDTRVRRAYFPELGDEVYQSLVSVPIFARAGDVIGVITLHAEAPHEFARTDLDFLEHTASLISGAVENARLYEDATARVALLSNLSSLSQRIASAGSQEEVLAAVVPGVRDLLGADRVEIHLLDGDSRLGLAEARPERPAAAPVGTRALWHDALQASPSPLGIDDFRRLGAAWWGGSVGGIPLVVPLIASDEALGLLAVLVPGPIGDADTILAGVAAHASVALKQHQVIERLREQNLLKDFFQALARADSSSSELATVAARLGCDLDELHVVMHVVPWIAPGARSRSKSRRPARTSLTWPERAGQVTARLAARFPGLLSDDLERSVRALVPVSDGSAEGVVSSLREMDWGDAATEGVSVGVSDACGGASSFARGFEEAISAAEVGALIRGTPGVTSYEELGPYKYVLDREHDVRDRAQQRLELLVDYDHRRGTRLLDTLEGYLDHRGNIAGTSRALYIHPNTLRQRLARIERESGIDLNHDDWLSLAVATKVVKLRRMRRTAAPEKGER
ncbi:MAG TPA: GAF domain-containing protein [Actinomycetota bacterium]|jgi:GAF domain-containing protein|nr:GAF domain-containing protein [Actinomycetota bacterium]